MSIPLSLPFYWFYPFLCLCLHMPIYLFLFFPFSPSVPLGSIDQCIPLSPFPSLPMTNFPLFVFEICVLLLLKAKATFYPNHLFTFFRLLFLYSLFFLSFFTSSSIFHFVLLLFNKMCFSPFFSLPLFRTGELLHSSFDIIRRGQTDQTRSQIAKIWKETISFLLFFPKFFSLPFPLSPFSYAYFCLLLWSGISCKLANTAGMERIRTHSLFRPVWEILKSAPLNNTEIWVHVAILCK